MADKTLLVGVYITLGLQGYLPNRLVVLVVFRDLLIVGGVIILFLVRLEVKMRPLIISKVNTAAQLALAAIVLAKLGFPFDMDGLVHAAIYIVGATTVISGASYMVSWTRQMAGVGKKAERTVKRNGRTAGTRPQTSRRDGAGRFFDLTVKCGCRHLGGQWPDCRARH